MVTQCSPLNQLRSINIDLKTRGGHTAPKTDNYTPGHQQRLHFIRSLRAIFAGQDDNEGLIAIRVREKIFNRKYFEKARPRAELVDGVGSVGSVMIRAIHYH